MHLAGEEGDRVLAVGRVHDLPIGGGAANPVDHERTRDARDRRLVRPVHIGHHDQVRLGEARPELAPERLGPRIPMGLEHRDHATGAPRSRHLERHARAPCGTCA